MFFRKFQCFFLEGLGGGEVNVFTLGTKRLQHGKISAHYLAANMQNGKLGKIKSALQNPSPTFKTPSFLPERGFGKLQAPRPNANDSSRHQMHAKLSERTHLHCTAEPKLQSYTVERNSTV